MVAKCSYIIPSDISTGALLQDTPQVSLPLIADSATLLTDTDAERIGETCASLAGRGLRVLGLALKLHGRRSAVTDTDRVGDEYSVDHVRDRFGVCWSDRR